MIWRTQPTSSSTSVRRIWFYNCSLKEEFVHTLLASSLEKHFSYTSLLSPLSSLLSPLSSLLSSLSSLLIQVMRCICHFTLAFRSELSSHSLTFLWSLLRGEKRCVILTLSRSRSRSLSFWLSLSLFLSLSFSILNIFISLFLLRWLLFIRRVSFFHWLTSKTSTAFGVSLFCEAFGVDLGSGALEQIRFHWKFLLLCLFCTNFWLRPYFLPCLWFDNYEYCVIHKCKSHGNKLLFLHNTHTLSFPTLISPTFFLLLPSIPNSQLMILVFLLLFIVVFFLTFEPLRDWLSQFRGFFLSIIVRPFSLPLSPSLSLPLPLSFSLSPSLSLCSLSFYIHPKQSHTIFYAIQRSLALWW